MTGVWFNEPMSLAAVGAKGYNLGLMTRSGLPVPWGFCIPVDAMHSVCPLEIEEALSRLSTVSVAVRSSVIGEDARFASFAGIHTTRLNVRTAVHTWKALQEIGASGISSAAMAYRHKLGIAEPPLMAAVVQTFIAAESGGVLFMRDPVDGSDRFVIEGCWGLGEGVVSGTVTPDRWILAPDGQIITESISDKDTAIVPGEHGTMEIQVSQSRRQLPCLGPEEISELLRLARACGFLFGEPKDLEWAVSAGRVWVLQSRPITRRAIASRGA